MTDSRDTNARPASGRRKAHAEMLEAALARPGAREAMRVFEAWREKDRGLDAWRSATRKARKAGKAGSTGFPGVS